MLDANADANAVCTYNYEPILITAVDIILHYILFILIVFQINFNYYYIVAHMHYSLLKGNAISFITLYILNRLYIFIEAIIIPILYRY